LARVNRFDLFCKTVECSAYSAIASSDTRDDGAEYIIKPSYWPSPLNAASEEGALARAGKSYKERVHAVLRSRR